MARKVDYEAKFFTALKVITQYMSTGQLRRQSEMQYGVPYEESLEMAYENIQEEARAALKGYRRPQAASPSTGEPK